MKLLCTLLALTALVACKSNEASKADDEGVLALGIPAARIVEPQLVSSGQFTEAQFQKLPELGYKTVIQLRMPTEEGTGWEEAKAKELGLEFIRIPVEHAKGLTEANARRLDEVLKNRKGGTLVACNSGNRVGGLFALRAYYCAGKTPEQCLEAGRKAGLTKAEPEVRKALGMPEAK